MDISEIDNTKMFGNSKPNFNNRLAMITVGT